MVDGRRDGFPPIADYGFLSDCESMALVAPGGAVEWMCLPRIDSPSVFGAALDRSAGSFRIGPDEVTEPAARRYIPGTMALETSWWTPGGWLVVLDALLIGPWHHENERSHTHRRPPTDYDADHVLLRMVRCVSGRSQVRMDCTPMFDYGAVAARWEHTGDGYHEAVASAGDDGSDHLGPHRDGGRGGLELRLTSDMNIGFEGPRATARTLLKEGDARFVALSWSEHAAPRTLAEATERYRRTCHHWQHWLDQGQFPDHPWRAYLQRSALTLKGLTFAPSGAVAAAATTSLPETPGGERNWDYRYTWIRDATMTLWAMFTLGLEWEAGDFFAFVADVAEAEGGELQVMYGVDGERLLEERTLEHLSGYEGALPVRVGNAAHTQRQHDVWGSVVGAIHSYTLLHGGLDDRIWRIVETQVEQALLHWREPDQGIWEVRSGAQHFTASKLACWKAADSGARLAESRGAKELAHRWRQGAEEIRTDILDNGLDERGVFTQAYGSDALDASVLLIPLLGFLPGTDERVKRTVLAIADELTEHGLVLRYRTDVSEDGLSGAEGTFTICSFWLVSALVAIGETDRARLLCEKLLSYASSLQLYAEEIDPVTGRHLGNFPQAFTHLSLINAVTAVIRATSSS
ncbi:glycoside hydrolase family 15 protein [Pseudonocardia spinosispora]|uniref:glycoside hydrolase family 15 protein n=1 Tax=Pseudonocardia spinosispora TaxID=103441 RepID=UPI000407C65A|nr:glycoside hydrolase family 15 protein [Pseudonocardia spinosispora]